MRRLGSERGIALAMAIFALVVVGGLIAGSFFMAMLEQRAGRNTLKQQAAFSTAETAAQDVVLNWGSGSYNGMVVNTSQTTNGTAPDGSWYRRTVKRLGDMIFLVTAEGFNRDSTTRAKVGYLLRLRPLAFNINAALKTQGATRVGGSSMISGADSIPPSWTGCPAAAPDQPGIRMPDPSLLNTNGGCSGATCITGDPAVLRDTTINTGSLTTVGDIPFDSLRTFATKIMPAGNYQQIGPTLDGSGGCNTADVRNWGDPVTPTNPCGGYFPIIWVDGDLQLGSGYGQGVLIVDGSLTVNGGFEFYGPVLVKQTLSTAGTGGHFNGGVIAANTDLCTSNSCSTSVMGNAVINYSSCALIKAMTQTATGSLMKQRSWLALY